MSLYLALARMSFQKQLAYRAANLAGVATNGFFGALRAFVMLALFQNTIQVNGWTATDAVTYVALGQAMIMVISMWGNNELPQSIQSGEVASDLSKPVDYYFFWLARFMGRSLYGAAFRGALTFAAIGLFFRIHLPPDLWGWLAFAAALFGAVLVSFGIHFLTSALVFWTLDPRGINAMLTMLAMLLSGFIVPITFFPDRLAAIARTLPWSAMVQIPVDVYLGKTDGLGLAAALGFQLGWFLVLMLAGRLMIRLMLRRLVIQGG